MKIFSLMVLMLLIGKVHGQIQKDTVPVRNQVATTAPFANVKEQLVLTAMQNANLDLYDANIRVAELNVKKAKSTWLNSVTLSGNINEFVVNNSPISNFYPKYNFGFNLPLGAIGIRKADVQIAKETVSVHQIEKDVRIKAIRAEVLRRFEIFLDRRYQLNLQTETTGEQYTIYLMSQKEYSASKITLDKLNQSLKDYNAELSEKRTFEREYNIAIIDLEEIVGPDLQNILQQYNLIAK